MNNTHRIITIIGILVAFFDRSLIAQVIPSNVHRILFLGNSITYAGNYITDMETWAAINYPSRHIEFINAGLPSETVSGLSEPGHASGRFPRPDLHERLARVLAQTKPDLIFACYGMNDGIYMPLDSARFRKFREGIFWLHEQLQATGATVIHVTPPLFDEERGGSPGYAAVLDTYSSWLLGLRDSLHWQVADVHFAMKTEFENRRKKDPGFYFAADGVHPDSTGHFLMAKQLLLYLGAQNVAAANGVADLYRGSANGRQIYTLINQRQSMMKDAWLTSTGHTRPEMNIGLPMRMARKKYRKLDRQIDRLRS